MKLVLTRTPRSRFNQNAISWDQSHSCIENVERESFSPRSGFPKIRKHVFESSRTIFRLRSGNCLRTGRNSYLLVGRSALRHHPLPPRNPPIQNVYRILIPILILFLPPLSLIRLIVISRRSMILRPPIKLDNCLKSLKSQFSPGVISPKNNQTRFYCYFYVPSCNVSFCVNYAEINSAL